MKLSDKTKTPACSRGFALWGLTCLIETFVQGSTFLLRINGGAKSPALRVAVKF
jgi:hypothetical protein